MNIDTLAIGPKGKILEWLDVNNLAHKPPTFRIGENKDYSVSLPGRNQIVVTVNLEKAVFKNVNISEIDLGEYKLDLIPKKKVTIISELKDFELYLECKALGKEILANCLDIPKDVQFEWIYDNNGHLDPEHWKRSDYVSGSATYIRNMTNNPSAGDIKEFFDAVRGGQSGGTAGVLEYLIHAKPAIGAFFEEALIRSKV